LNSSEEPVGGGGAQKWRGRVEVRERRHREAAKKQWRCELEFGVWDRGTCGIGFMRELGRGAWEPRVPA
jgi:hypothetical protein